MAARGARILVLTGTGLSIIFCAFTLFIHNRLYGKDLEQAQALGSRLEAQLREPRPGAPGPPPTEGADAVELALAAQPNSQRVDAAALYGADERQAFAAARVRGALGTSREARTLLPPARVDALYAAGTVRVSWDPGPVNAVLAGTLAGQAGDVSLAFRVYRARDLGEPALLATLPFGTHEWQDRDLPLPAARLDYEVWTVLLRAGPAGEVLVGAERSQKVTVRSPEHFKLGLVGGTESQAAFDVEVEVPPGGTPVVVHARPGEPLLVGDRPLGLRLESLRQTVEERLTTQRRMVLTADGSLVLDPTTHEPRTTQTQVLVPVTRLTATLVSQDGEVRTLDTDLR